MSGRSEAFALPASELEPATQAHPCTVQSCPHRRRWQRERHGDLARLQRLPSSKSQQLAVLVAQLVEGGVDQRVLCHGVCGIVDGALGEVGLEALAEPAAAPLGAVVVEQHHAGYAEQPRSRLFAYRDVVQSSPGDEHRLRDHIRRILRVRYAAQCVGQQRTRMGAKQGAETGFRVSGTLAHVPEGRVGTR